MEMQNLGKKMGGESNIEAGKDQVYYPETTIEQKTLPELKGKNIGDTIKLIVEARICSISEYKNGEIEYRLEFRKAAIQEDKNKE